MLTVDTDVRLQQLLSEIISLSLAVHSEETKIHQTTN